MISRTHRRHAATSVVAFNMITTVVAAAAAAVTAVTTVPAVHYITHCMFVIAEWQLLLL